MFFAVYKTQFEMWRAFFIMFVYYTFVCPEDEGVIDYCPKEKYKTNLPLETKCATTPFTECKASSYRRTPLHPSSVESWGRCYEVIISSLELMFWQRLT